METNKADFYEASGRLLDILHKASEPSNHTTDYESLLGLCGVTEFKMLLSGILPSYFKYFPSLQEKALNCQLDLCEDDDIKIRREAIKHLPVLCRGTPSFAARIADVLWQLLQTEYPDELATVKEALLATYSDYPDKTLTAMFHQMAQTIEVRSVAVDYLITQLIPKGLTPALDTLLGTRIVKALEHYDLNYEVFSKLFKIFQGLSLYQDPAMRLTLVRLVVVRPTEDGADIATISKDLIQRANLLMPIFKTGVSSSDFVQLIFAYASHLVLDWDMQSPSHLHLVMLLADMIKLQQAPFDRVVVQKDYGMLIELLQAHYSSGLGNIDEQKHCILLAEPFVFALCYLVTLSGASVAEIDVATAPLLRQLLLSSQLSKDYLAKKVIDASKSKAPSPKSETAAQKKALVRNYRAAQNIYSMLREILKPVQARRKLDLTLSWKTEPVRSSPTGTTPLLPSPLTSATVTSEKVGSGKRKAKESRETPAALKSPEKKMKASVSQSNLSDQGKQSKKKNKVPNYGTQIAPTSAKQSKDTKPSKQPATQQASSGAKKQPAIQHTSSGAKKQPEKAQPKKQTQQPLKQKVNQQSQPPRKGNYDTGRQSSAPRNKLNRQAAAPYSKPNQKPAAPLTTRISIAHAAALKRASDQRPSLAPITTGERMVMIAHPSPTQFSSNANPSPIQYSAAPPRPSPAPYPFTTPILTPTGDVRRVGPSM